MGCRVPPLTVPLCRQLIEEAVRRGSLSIEYLHYEDPRRRVRRADTLCEGIVRGRDWESFSSVDELLEWLSWSTVLLDEKDYLTATVHALSLAPKIAATDYGTARQRDLGQLVTDAVRGFLGEIALAKWLKARFGISVSLDYRRGRLAEFLPSDIKLVNGRPSNLNVSIKTTKLRGMWLDIPFKQIEHSHVFVLVRVGVSREHFLAFLKEISAIKDKILAKAFEMGIVSEDERDNIWRAIPKFTRIPASIAGFFDKREYEDAVSERTSIILAGGEMKRKRFIVNLFAGYWHPERREYRERILEVLRRQGYSVPENVKIEFAGIGNFSRTLHFIVSSGALRRRREDWERLVRDL